ncbi:hypothetical protein VSR01_23760 [Actinacidiphila sp. DG2A-62]|uniref:hypothetical protein n=1 Tax=Actinacidiphila sp. DG2A-62 TaxID=3108821 RepID=UPI002DBBA4C8|nr:hypothetical protein [Actinacidiphila sp. DG2A-62]MEC3996361.1 hypothetical protein [Actinacidiphila sp. DG2A-62]
MVGEQVGHGGDVDVGGVEPAVASDVPVGVVLGRGDDRVGPDAAGAREIGDAYILHPGDTLRTSNGPAVHVTRVRNYTGHIVTYNLTVSELHTYYVVAGGTPILVHNCNTLSFKAGEADIRYRKHVLGVLKNGALKPGGADMPEFLDKVDYVRGARDLLGGDLGEGVLEATRGTDTLRFDTNTGEFGVKTSDGTIRTFFRPGGGEGYFRTLPGLTPVNY